MGKRFGDRLSLGHSCFIRTAFSSNIQRIYHIKKQTRQTAAPPACRELIQRDRSRPIAEELHRFVLAQRQRHLPGSDVAQAISYTLNQCHKILVCFVDGALLGRLQTTAASPLL